MHSPHATLLGSVVPNLSPEANPGARSAGTTDQGIRRGLIQMAAPCAWGMAGQGVTSQKMTSAVSGVRLSLHYFISVSDTPGELQCFHCSNETVDQET